MDAVKGQTIETCGKDGDRDGNHVKVNCSRAVVLAFSKHGRVAGSVDGACGAEHRVDSETRDGACEYSDTNSTA